MSISNDMGQMIFSYGYYDVLDFDKIKEFLTTLEEKDLFVADRIDSEGKEINGSFIRDYPKNHWSPMSKTPGAKQVIGGVELKKGILKIDTKTKNTLQELRDMFEVELKDSIKFQKVEYQDLMSLLKNESKA
ncbi:MAG: hypothetical protein ACQESJ_06325 [Bacteroidota bacterium]